MILLRNNNNNNCLQFQQQQQHHQRKQEQCQQHQRTTIIRRQYVTIHQPLLFVISILLLLLLVVDITIPIVSSIPRVVGGVNASPIQQQQQQQQQNEQQRVITASSASAESFDPSSSSSTTTLQNVLLTRVIVPNNNKTPVTTNKVTTTTTTKRNKRNKNKGTTTATTTTTTITTLLGSKISTTTNNKNVVVPTTKPIRPTPPTLPSTNNNNKVTTPSITTTTTKSVTTPTTTLSSSLTSIIASKREASNSTTTSTTTTNTTTTTPTTPITTTPKNTTSNTTTNTNTSNTIPIPYRINCGYNRIAGRTYTDSNRNVWVPDDNINYIYDPFRTSKIKSMNVSIHDTVDDFLYQNIREGGTPSVVEYNFPVPLGNYDIILHFVELEYNTSGIRIFDISIENIIVTSSFDIIQQNPRTSRTSGGIQSAYKLQYNNILIDDGILNIVLTMCPTSIIPPVIAGIEILSSNIPHLAHAVSGGPYSTVDTTRTNRAFINLDGSQSHTHSDMKKAILTKIEWYINHTMLVSSSKLKDRIQLPVGEHELTLQVTDSTGSTSTDVTSVTVHPFGYPTVFLISPTTGPLQGRNSITIRGSGFIYKANETIVYFGSIDSGGIAVSGDNQLRIINPTTIQVLLVPPSILAKDVPIFVQTPMGITSEQKTIRYKYSNPSSPIAFTMGKLMIVDRISVCRFSPIDQALYVGSSNGRLGRIVLDFTSGIIPKIISSRIQQVISADRAILGIAFDPMDLNTTVPKIYFSSSDFFHGDPTSSSGMSINGQISRMEINITNMNNGRLNVFNNIVPIITGLPVSDHDHGINAIEFGNNGELYITVAGNTNGGIPGKLTTSGIQKDNILSSSIVVAYINAPKFNGNIQYTQPDDGDMIPNPNIQLFAHGLRNPYGIVLHSNGKLYATDNGPNYSYGPMSTGCDLTKNFIPGMTDKDKVVLVEKGNYYGQPNMKRATRYKDPRQCIWHPTTDLNSTNGYTAPLAVLPSSIDGIIDYHANYFDGQLLGNLIVSKFGDGLYRIVLTPDGNQSILETRTGIPLQGTKGLDLTLGPDGSIFEARYGCNEVWFQKPIEVTVNSSVTKLYSVFPTRGPSVGGNLVRLYGINFDPNNTIVTIGTVRCQQQFYRSNKQIDCIMPGGVPGPIDITVRTTYIQGLSSSTSTSTFVGAYRYITGMP